ncbi:MAG TPA: cytochrome C oxidase subunit IV family protein [Symbiobacteriaceae bacterium]|nr:cytochrome C oxidase subunit IV family protein [Symbiobacteriaceae bacterium]
MAKIQGRTQTQAKVVERSHPSVRTFVSIGAILFVITAAEFGIVYLQGFQTLVVAGLFLFSAVKFFLVVSYFMHLRWDSRLLGWIFAVGAVLALLMTLAQKYVNLA